MGGYKTAKQTSFSDPKIKLVYWTLFVLLLLLMCWGLYSDPTWMDQDVASGNIQIEVEGGGSSTFSYGDIGSQPDEWTYQTTLTYDAKELRIPSDEPNALFLASWISPHQHQSRNSYCGDPTKPCETDADCRTKHKSFFGQDQYICADFYCLIRAWCPIQFPISERRIDGIDEWKIFLKVVAVFPSFKTSRANFDPEMKRIEKINEFTVEEILKEVGTKYEKIRDTGIIISVTISFKCLYHVTKCDPKVVYERIDNEKGFGWLYKQYKPNLIIGKSFFLPEIRQTYEVRGLRIIVTFEGAMYRFNPIGLLLAVGAMAGILNVATTVTDFIILNIHEKRDIYVMHKYNFVNPDRLIESVQGKLKKHLTRLGYY